MGNEIELVSDGDGLAALGASAEGYLEQLTGQPWTAHVDVYSR